MRSHTAVPRAFATPPSTRAIWIGTPYMSRWEQESLGSDRPDVDRSLLGRFNDFGQLQALAREARERLRYVLVTHDNDGVACFGLDLLVRAPDWLGPAETRPAGVPKTEQWQSPATFIQTLIDMKNSANVIPGQFEAKGHDGSLLGLFTQRHSPATAAWMTSILFGVCHVLPTLRTLPMNPAGARVRGNLKRTGGAALAAITATTLGGYGLAWLRCRSGSVAAPAVAHATLNATAYLAARFVVRAAS